MVKGVNKNIIEIAETGNKYFTKAIFFISPEFSKSNEAVLQNEAKTTFQNLSKSNFESGESLRAIVKKEGKAKIRNCLIAAALTIIATIIVISMIK